MKKEIYTLLEKELSKFSIWMKDPNRKKEDFDIDETMDTIFHTYHLDINYGFFYPIYCFYDVVSDAIRHEKKEISNGYFLVDAERDLNYIIDHITLSQIDELEQNELLRNRLISLYNE